MRKREPVRLNWRDTSLGILTEMAYVGAMLLVAALVALLVGRGVQ